MMVKPLHFGYNEETAASNSFQQAAGKEHVQDIRNAALEEFEHFVTQLRANNIEVVIFSPDDGIKTTDEVFPNNWVSFHHDGTVVTYPMMAKIRRQERRMEFITTLEKTHGFVLRKMIDLSHFENQQVFLEGTGSMVIDYVHGIAYGNTSPRTHPELFNEACTLLNLEPCLFQAVDQMGQDIYHTNVMMCIGGDFAVICLEAIKDLQQRKQVRQKLEETNHEIVALSYQQMNAFAGNMMEVSASQGSVLVMSQSARNSLDHEQVEVLERYSTILAIPIPTIERFGGGSVRCMMAGVFLPHQ